MYIVLAGPYYFWASQNLSKTHPDNSVNADARWMAETFTIVSQKNGVAMIRSVTGTERRVPVDSLMELPES